MKASTAGADASTAIYNIKSVLPRVCNCTVALKVALMCYATISMRDVLYAMRRFPMRHARCAMRYATISYGQALIHCQHSLSLLAPISRAISH